VVSPSPVGQRQCPEKKWKFFVITLQTKIFYVSNWSWKNSTPLSFFAMSIGKSQNKSRFSDAAC
jgi:hypothetical protein